MRRTERKRMKFRNKEDSKNNEDIKQDKIKSRKKNRNNYKYKQRTPSLRF